MATSKLSYAAAVRQTSTPPTASDHPVTPSTPLDRAPTRAQDAPLAPATNPGPTHRTDYPHTAITPAHHSMYLTSARQYNSWLRLCLLWWPTFYPSITHNRLLAPTKSSEPCCPSSVLPALGPLMSLRILQHNMQGGLGRLAGLEGMLLDFRADVACLQETHFRDNISKVGEYRVIMGTPCLGGHGVAILVRTSIRCRPIAINLPPRLGLEVAGVAISAGNREIVILTLYVSPAVRTTMEVWDELTRYITPTTIVCGDLNAHNFSWDPGSPVDRRGQQVINWAEDASLLLLNDGTATRLGHNHQRDTAVDLTFVTPALRLASSWAVLTDIYASDHFPCGTTLQIAPEDRIHRSFYTTRKWNIKDADWHKYAMGVMTRLADTSQPIGYAELATVITDAADASISRTGPRPSSPRHNPKPWWTAQCTEVVQERRRALTTYTRVRSAANYEEYRNVSRRATRILQKAKRDGWRGFLEDLRPGSTDMRQVWRMARRYASRHDPPNHTRGEWLDGFLHRFTPDSVTLPPPLTLEDRTIPAAQHLAEPITIMGEVQVALTACRRDTSPGMAGIPYALLRHLPEVGIRQLTEVYNNIFDTGMVPPAREDDLLLPFLKPKKDPADAASYRPILLYAKSV